MFSKPIAFSFCLFATLVFAQPPNPAKRPMTFEDLMAMKRLGETAVSPEGKWLAYSVTTVDLEKNTKTLELWLQAIAGGEPMKLVVGRPGDGGAQFSADGKRILFTSSRDGSQQVWVADFDAEKGATSNAKKLTSIATEADNAQWSHDGSFVVFTSAVYPDCPAITFENSDGDKCNADRDKEKAESKVKAQIWTQLLYRHWNHFTGDKRSHLFLVEVDSGKMRDLNPGDAHDVPPFSLEGGGGFSIAPDSKELAFTENPDPVPAISTSAQIYTVDLTDAAAKPVKISTSAGGNFNPAYSPDGKYLAWRSQARAGYESDKFRLALFNRQKHTLDYPLNSAVVFEPGPKPANFDRWVDEFSWRDDSKLIYFTSGYDGEAPIQSISMEPLPRDAEMALHEGAVDQQPAPRADGDRRPVHWQLSRYGKIRGEWSGIHGVMVNGRFRLLGTLMRVDMPSEVVLGDPLEIDDSARTMIVSLDNSAPTKETTQKEYAPVNVTHLNDALLAQLDLPKMESFWFTAKDGTKEQGFLIRPPGFDPAKKYPVKFLIHGGPQGAWGDSWSYRWNAELFAANGYVVVMINPGGSTGYGQAFVDRVNGDWGGKPFTDLMTGFDYAEQHYPFIDKTRECALGASYGGYMANWVLGHTDRFKCIVSHDGMFDAESAFGSTEEDWFNIWEFKGNPWDYYGKPDSENPFRKWSPSLYAKNFKTPTLVVHSQLDYRLDVSEGFQLFDTLQLLHVPSKMLYFPDEGHWVLKPQNSRLWYKTVNAWVDQWTQPKSGGAQ
ncbi:MAG TPA: S9 family peptidase [Terracidiphilus sp.]|jgi:dipeptidyl aminopeptidase/acylaminoacyl peptidase|nr:S9 family peptidase [Terracidiphilus sp.]